jgi:hypothetical protein
MSGICISAVDLKFLHYPFANPRTPPPSRYNPATKNCVVLITSQDSKPIQAALQSNAMHKIKVAELYNRPRFRERTGTDPSFVGPSFIRGSQENSSKQE